MNNLLDLLQHIGHRVQLPSVVTAEAQRSHQPLLLEVEFDVLDIVACSQSDIITIQV